MPKRTNMFQRLVFLIQKQMAPLGVQVSESQLIPDPVTGVLREADILVALPTGTNTANMVIEVRDHKRKQGLTWVDEVAGKWQNFPVTVCLVSRSGFTNSALDSAQQRGLTALTWEEAENIDWRSLALVGPQLPLEFSIPTLEQLLVETDRPVTPADMPLLKSLEATVTTPDFTKEVSLRKMADILLKKDDVQAAIQQHVSEKRPTFSVTLHVDPIELLLLFPSKTVYRILSFTLNGLIEIRTTYIKFQPFRLGEAQGAWGTADAGKGASVVATASPKGDGGSIFQISVQGLPRVVDFGVKTGENPGIPDGRS